MGMRQSPAARVGTGRHPQSEPANPIRLELIAEREATEALRDLYAATQTATSASRYLLASVIVAAVSTLVTAATLAFAIAALIHAPS